jgi:tetratricopeptide (TPR) repeat protein
MHAQSVAAESQRVKVNESPVSIPTHGPLGRDPWPNIFFKTQWFAPFYPLDRYIHPAGPRHEQTYMAVTLENEYVRVVVLPELGGHVWQMYDKVCEEHLVYNNDVVKPTRIGFRTAWCSIGIEFNFPVAHSLQSVDPLPYKIEHHEDGSASVRTWHRDRPRRLEMVLDLTLRPGRRDLQIRASMYNPSPIRRPYDYWTNVAVSARPQTQYVYPTRWMQGHGNRQVYAWPIVNGEDMRFQPNYQKTASFFAWDPEPPFFGCWWSDTNNGLVHVADPRSCPGKKLFNWGKRATAWLTAVTDKAGPYAELQSGRFPTQADYQWLEPGQMEVLEEAWYGYHGLGGLSAAGKDLAMHLTTDGGDGKPATRAHLALHSVCDLAGTTIAVTADDQPVFTDKTDLLAAHPIHRDIDLPAGAGKRVAVVVSDRQGNTIGSHTLSLTPPAKARKPRARAEKWDNLFSPLEDKDAITRARIGETGELNNLWPRAREAYEAALQADAHCPEALLGLGYVCLRNANFDEAARCGQRLQTTKKSAWKQAGAFILGVAELGAGRAEAATAALAAAAGKTGPMARLLLSLAMAQLGRTAEALQTVAALKEPVASMPMALWLKAALTGDAFAADPAAGWTVADPAELLDLACERAIWAIRAGMPALGEQIIDNRAQRQALGNKGQAGIEGGAVSEPLAGYLKAYLQHLQGKDDAARATLAAVAMSPRGNTPPTQPEWTTILHWALQTNPADVKPHAYLAPLEYWLTQAQQAEQHWQALLRHDSDADSTDRYSLAMALWETHGDHKAAAETLAEALNVQPHHERLYLALDDILVEARDTEARGYWLQRARQAVGQTDPVAERYSHWLVNQQRWREVIDLLTEHKFGPSHGLFIRRRMWLLAHHRQALQCLTEGDYAKAYEYGLAGSRPPTSLGEDDMTMPFASPVLLAAAEACEKMGDKAQARQLCRQALDLASSGHTHPPYTEIHRARVMLKMGKRQAGADLLQEVLNQILPRLEDSRPNVNKAHFHFLYALILETQGQAEAARRQYAQADQLGLQWANLVGYSVQWGFN